MLHEKSPWLLPAQVNYGDEAVGFKPTSHPLSWSRESNPPSPSYQEGASPRRPDQQKTIDFNYRDSNPHVPERSAPLRVDSLRHSLFLTGPVCLFRHCILSAGDAFTIDRQSRGRDSHPHSPVLQTGRSRWRTSTRINHLILHTIHTRISRPLSSSEQSTETSCRSRRKDPGPLPRSGHRSRLPSTQRALAAWDVGSLPSPPRRRRLHCSAPSAS